MIKLRNQNKKQNYAILIQIASIDTKIEDFCKVEERVNISNYEVGRKKTKN